MDGGFILLMRFPSGIFMNKKYLRISKRNNIRTLRRIPSGNNHKKNAKKSANRKILEIDN